METIKCDICGNDRPQIEMVPIECPEDENYVICTHCLEVEMFEREMIFPEQLSTLVMGW